MYSINGIALHDPARDWTVLDSSEWTSATSITRAKLRIPGMDGGFPLPGYEDAPALALVIGLPHSGLASLRTLLNQPTLELGRAGTPGTVTVELASLTPTRAGGAGDAAYEVKIALEIPGLWFRDDVTTETAVIDAASVTATVFQGISGKVRDALVRVTDVTDPQITDAAGMFIKYTGSVAAGSWLRFHSDSGRAWLTDTDAWDGGTEVDPLAISYGRGPGFFHITPSFTDPDHRAGELTVTTSAFGTTAAIDIQGRNAYIV